MSSSSATRPRAQQARWEDTAAVDDEEVVGPQQRGQVVEVMVGEAARGALQQEQP
jgi:hypothetical protein